MRLESLEARIVVHEKNEAVYEENIAFLNNEGFNQKSAAKTNKFNEKVNTARVNNVTTAGPKAVVSAAVGNGKNAVKFLACWIWRQKGNVIDHVPKNSESYIPKRFDYVDPQGRLNGCSRHMTGNKSFITDYQEIDDGIVAFKGSPKSKVQRVQMIRLLMMLERRMKLMIQQKKIREGREKSPRNEFGKCALDKKGYQWNSTYRMFTPVNAIGSSYENLGGSIPVNAATFSNDDFPTDPLMPDLEDTADLQVTGIFSGAYDDEDVGAEGNSSKKQGNTGCIRLHQEEGIDYDEVFAPVARIEAVRFDAQEVSNEFYGGAIISSWVAVSMQSDEVKTTSTPIETNKALLKDEEAEDVDSHLYRSIIGSLMYLTASRLVKRIFRYLKGQPKLGLWYPRDSPFDLEAFFDSDYAGASLDRKSTTRGCQFIGKRLNSWQYKKQTIVANSTTEAEYVAAFNYCGQVLWIQNQMLDYGFNFMNTKIHIDNESTICIVKNPVFHSKTKHIEIRHHFIRDSYEKRLIQVIKIHTDHNVVDLVTKAFNVSSDEFGVKTGSCQVNAASSKSTAWNEFSLNIASAVICLANNQKFNFSKLIFDEPFNDTYETPKHTQKVFTNMRRKGKSFSGAVTPLFQSMLAIQAVEGEGSGQPSEPQPTPSPVPPSHEVHVTTVASHPQKTQTPRRAKRGQDTKIPQSGGPPEKVGDEAVHKELGDRVERDATTAASLDAEQDSGNILKTQSMTRSERVPTSSYDSPLLGGNTPESDEERLEQHELTDNGSCLGNIKDCSRFGDQKAEKESQKIRKEAKGKNSRDETLQDYDFDDDFNDIDDMVNEAMENVEGDTVNAAGVVNTATTRVSAASALVTTAGVSISTVEPRTPPTTTTTAFEDEDLTIAQTLIKILHKEEKATLERMKRDRAAQEEASNVALTTEFDDIFSGDNTKRKRFFAAQRAEQIRNKPPTKTQLRNKMITFLKNMGMLTYNQLKNKSLEEIQKLYEREQKWINDFVPMDSKMVKDSGKKDDDSQKQAESSKKRPRAEHDEESVKKQKLEDDAEKEELRACLDIV
ncbi:hypothetical protein Tco_1152734, partial [Tanacetum coccineum]